MRTLSEKIWTVVEYAPPVATLLFACWMGLEINRRPVELDQKLTWILIVLGLIATTQLIERMRSLRLIRSGIERLPDLLRRETKLFKRDSREVRFRELAREAVSIDIAAWSCIAFFNNYDGFIRDKIEQGCKVRILIIEEEAAAAQVIMANSEDKDLIDDIHRMKDRAERFCANLAKASGSLELRTIGWLLPFGMVVVNGDRPKGTVSIGMHPIFLPTPRDTRRFLLVDSTISTTDFTYFRDQFNDLWKQATTVCFSQVSEATVGSSSQGA